MSLSAAELASMQSTLNASLVDAGTIYRGTIVDDGYGHGSAGWTAVGTAACRVAPMAIPAEVVIAGRLGTDTIWRITFPAATDVKASDQVQTSSRKFEVQGVNQRSNEISRRVTAAEIL